jgi:hypothetical protein
MQRIKIKGQACDMKNKDSNGVMEEGNNYHKRKKKNPDT